MNAIQSFSALGVEGCLHQPANPAGRAMVLTHGAGSNSQAPLLLAVAEAFCDQGWLVLRYDLPFRQKRRSGPPHPSQSAEDQAGLRKALEALAGEVSGEIYVAGHSYGGRQASMLLANEPEAAAGILLLSYPLHPPKQPEKLRTAHFIELRTPALFVHGTADPFGSPEEMREALSHLSGPFRLSLIGGAEHDLKRGRFDIGQQVITPFFHLIGA